MSDEPEETSYYLRLLSMYMDLGTEIVLDVFVYHTPGQDAETFLKSKQGEIIQLKESRVLNGQECDLLFKKGKTVLISPLDIKGFDISLFITLSRNLFTSGELQPPVKGWNNPPKNSDKSVAADLMRLKKTRNVIVGHHPSARLPLLRFEDEWKNVSEILIRLQQQISPEKVKHLQARIDAYRLQRLDPTVMNKYDAKLKQWHNDVTTLQDQVEELIKKLGGFEAYFNNKSDRFERYTKLLFKGGHFVLSAFLDKKIKDEGKDLRTMLTDKEDAIRRDISDDLEQLAKVYPSNPPTPTDPIDTCSWNVSLLATVISQLFSSTEDEGVIKYVKKIGEACKKYANAALIALDSNEFEDYWTDLKSRMKIVSCKLDERNVERYDQILNECKRQIDEKEFKTYMEELKKQGTQIKSFTETFQDVLQRSKDFLQDRITKGISFKKVQVLELKTITLGTDEQQKKLAEEILMKVWKAALDRAVQSTDFLGVKKEVLNILNEIKKSKSVENISVRAKCILLQIEITSPGEILDMIECFQSKQFHESIRNISIELGYFLDTAIDVHSVITVECLWRMYNQRDETEQVKEEGLTLQMTVSSPAGMKHLMSLCSKDTISNCTNSIADALTKHLGGTISLKAVTEMKEFKHVFDTDSSSSDSCSDYSSMESNEQDNNYPNTKNVEDMCYISEGLTVKGRTNAEEELNKHIEGTTYALKSLKLISNERDKESVSEKQTRGLEVEIKETEDNAKGLQEAKEAKTEKVNKDEKREEPDVTLKEFDEGFKDIVRGTVLSGKEEALKEQQDFKDCLYHGTSPVGRQSQGYLSDEPTKTLSETNQDHIYNNALKNLKLASSEALEEKGEHIVETDKRMFEVDEGLTKFGKGSYSDSSSTGTNIKDNQTLHQIDTSTEGNDNIPEGQLMVKKSLQDKKELAKQGKYSKDDFTLFGTSTMMASKKQNVVLEGNTKQTEDFVDEHLQLEDRRTEEIEENLKGIEEDLNNIGIAEKRIKIVDHKVERMKENFQKALQEENHYAESFKDDISLITKQLTNNHRVIVTGYDNTLTYKCGLTSVRKRNYQPPDQCLEITNPSDWKRIIADDVQLVLFREPFGRAAYAPQKVEVMLEEFDTMLDATKDENEKIIDIVIVTNQRRLNEVIARTHKHEMLSPVSTIYIDSEAGDTQGEASSGEDTVFNNLLDFSKLYRQNYERKTVYNAVKFEAESIFVETSAVTIVGPARSGKTGLSFDLLPLYNLSNGEENFVLLMDPGELKYIKFSLRPVILLKLLYGTDFDKVEAYKWYRQFNRLHAAVLGKKAAVITIVETKTFKMWNKNMPAHHLLDNVVEISEKHANAVKKCEYDVQTENEDSNNARQDAEWYKTVSHTLKQTLASDLDVHTILGKPNETKEDKLGNSRYYRKDTQAWRRCIDMKDKQEAERLVNDRILPDQDLLDRATDLFGMSSSTVKNMCDSICLYIKENVNEIVSVYPAIDCGHKSTSQHITFIILVLTAQPSLSNINEYRCYTRCIHENITSHSDENMFIKEFEEDCQKDLCETKKIREILTKHSKLLMEHHTNITRISISWVKSKGYGTENPSMERKTCIAVNVQSKGFVPINENILPKTIDGIDVDIREGVAFSYGRLPNEHHEELKMGCAIHCGLRNEKRHIIGGTLGGFVEINKVLYCISCAHIFFSSNGMEKLKNLNKWCDLGDVLEKFEAHQPVLEGSQAFGEGIRAVYNEGGNGSTGVEAVIIEMKKRLPISGEFPKCPHNRTAGVKHQLFSSGIMSGRDEVNRLINEKKMTVVKFGCCSGWTRGSLRFDGASVRLNHMVASHNSFGMLLHNQFEVDSIGEIDFAVEGDSGSLVFTDENDQLSVIGIVEGGLSKTIFITPIFEVFDALGLQNIQEMKTFSSMQNERSQIQSVAQVSSNNLPSAMEVETSMNTSINQEMSLVKLEVTTLRSDVSALQSEVRKTASDSKKANNEVKSLIQIQTEMIRDISRNLGSQSQNPMTNTTNDSLSQTILPSTSNTGHN